MKILLALSTLSLVLMTGCAHESTMTEDTHLMDVYQNQANTEENVPVDTEESTNPEEESVTSVGPSDIPADLIPSR